MILGQAVALGIIGCTTVLFVRERQACRSFQCFGRYRTAKASLLSVSLLEQSIFLG